MGAPSRRRAGALVAGATRVREGAFPTRLWQRLGPLPYPPLLLPYRLTADVAQGVDYMASGCCEVMFDDAGQVEAATATTGAAALADESQATAPRSGE